MKIAIAVLVLTVSSAAQMTNATLLALDQGFAKVTTTEHFDGWMKYMMDYTVIFGPQGYSQIVSGKEQIRSFYEELFSMQDFKMNWTPTSAQVLPSGATGYTRGTFHWIMPNNKCKCVNDWHGTYLAVWEEENPGGKWKLKALFPSVDAKSVSCGCAANNDEQGLTEPVCFSVFVYRSRSGKNRRPKRETTASHNRTAG